MEVGRINFGPHIPRNLEEDAAAAFRQHLAHLQPQPIPAKLAQPPLAWWFQLQTTHGAVRVKADEVKTYGELAEILRDALRLVELEDPARPARP